MENGRLKSVPSLGFWSEIEKEDEVFVVLRREVAGPLEVDGERERRDVVVEEKVDFGGGFVAVGTSVKQRWGW